MVVAARPIARRSLLLLGLVALAPGCAAPPSPPPEPQPGATVVEAPADLAQPPTVLPPDVGAVPEPDPEPPAELGAQRLDDRTVIAGPDGIEEVAVIPDGVAFTISSDIWVAPADGGELRTVATTVDPHGLATDGRWLYWLGHEKNGRLELATGKEQRRPRFAVPSAQVDLAMGDVPYGLDIDGRVWRIEGNHLERVDLRTEPDVKASSAIGAGKRVVVVVVFDFASRATFLWRVRLGGKGHRIDTRQFRGRFWSVDAKGRLVFVRGGDVMRLDPKSTTPKRLFTVAKLTALCWCGSAVCTFSEDDDQILRHRPGASEPEVLVRGLGPVHRISCSDERVAWTAPGPNDAFSLSVVELD